MRTIRASEIGTFLYCRRAWWYRSQGIASQNGAELSGGMEFHRQHGRQVLGAGLMRILAWVLLLACAAALTVWAVNLLLP